MDFDQEDRPGDELEDYGDELSSDYKEEEEEISGEEGDELAEEVSYKVEETITTGAAPVIPAAAEAPNRRRLPSVLGRPARAL